MRLKRKVGAAVLVGVVWVAGLSEQAADVPIRSLASASHHDVVAHPSSTPQAVAPDAGGEHGRASAGASSNSVSVNIAAASGSAPQTIVSPAGVASVKQSPGAATANAPVTSAYDAGGSMAGSSQVSQVYQQSTQSGYGCQAALQYLSQHANPEFALVCPGNAMGHQAMTCYYRTGVCPDNAEIVIADPCPAAYENEAWNSWHVGTGPYDPYGWCSDWSRQQGPSAPTPTPTPPPTGGPLPPPGSGTSADSWRQSATTGA